MKKSEIEEIVVLDKILTETNIFKKQLRSGNQINTDKFITKNSWLPDVIDAIDSIQERVINKLREL